MNLIKLQFGLVRHNGMHRIETGIHGAIAAGLHGLMLAVHIQGHSCELRSLRACHNCQRHQLDTVLRIVDFIIDQGFEILIINMLFTVGQILETAERIFQSVFAQFIAQFLELFAEGMPSRMLAHDQRSFRDPDRFGSHNFIGLGIFQHAILMDAAFMRKGIPADNRLVVLHRKT